MFKIIVTGALSALVVALVFQVYGFWERERSAEADLTELRAKLEKARFDEEKLKAELEYLANPVNLEKELRQRFNFRGEGEKMIVIVPQNQTGTATSTP
ncbi:hypothetical protein C4571_00855 [Candidatus Parcubacteria bacterium]|nr:MAG: hypothetical protein C4571_00855 [Candidatus Parcubacteria bacterium]